MAKPTVLVCAFVLASAPAVVSAQAKRGTTSYLSWTRLPGADECIGPAELAKAVENKLGRSVFVSPADAALTVEGRVERRGRAWHATVRATRADGTVVGVRELDSDRPECSALNDDLVLVTALAIDPDATPGAARSAPPSPAAPPPKVIVVERAAPSAPPTWAVDVRADGAVVAGLLAGVVPAVHGSLALAHRRFWPLEIEGALTAVAAASNDGAGATMWLAYGGAALCPELRDRASPLRIAACGGVQIGTLVAAGDGLSQVDEGSRLLVTIALRARAAVRIAGPLRIHLEAGPVVALTRPAITYRDLDRTTLRIEDSELFRVSPIGGIAALGLGIEL